MKARYTFGAAFKPMDRDGNVLFEKAFSDSTKFQERTSGFGYKPQTLQEFYGDYQQELTVKYLEEAEGIIHLRTARDRIANFTPLRVYCD